MLAVWMNDYSVSDHDCNVVNLECMIFLFLQGMKKNVMFTFSVSHTAWSNYNFY
jgi:hypothetical protein